MFHEILYFFHITIAGCFTPFSQLKVTFSKVLRQYIVKSVNKDHQAGLSIVLVEKQ